MDTFRQEDKKRSKVSIVSFIISVVAILILIFITLPQFLPNHWFHRHPCSDVESDAIRIAAAIVDYFSIPSHTQISTADILYTYTGNNTFTITATDPSRMITITVTDGSGECPVEYQELEAGWDGNGVYTYTISP